MKRLIYFSILCLFFLACDVSKRAATTAKKELPPVPYEFPYDLDKPNQTFVLPESLNEISGISLSPNGKLIYAIQDENGILYAIDKSSGKVISEKKFYKDGDYEDIACVSDEEFYIVKSTGTIYHIQNTPADTFAIEKIKIGLSKENDVEGLFYDKKHAQLLLSCKEQMDKDHEDIRGVFAYDLKTNSKSAFMKINKKQIENHLVNSYKNTDDSEKFSPSAIAIHPIDGNTYWLASKGKMIVILSPDKRLVDALHFKKSVLHQPEGMFFDTDGTLYISNESKKDNPADIQRFEMRQFKQHD